MPHEIVSNSKIMKTHNKSFIEFIEENINWDALLKQYLKELAQNAQSSLIGDIFDIQEGMPSHLLERLLKYDNYKFLPSFVEKVLGMGNLSVDEQIADEEVVVTSKLKAFGSTKDSTEFIDLVIRIGEAYFLIKNKMDEEDTKWRSSRYAATILCVGIVSPYTADGRFDSDWYNKLDAKKKQKVDELLKHLYFYSLSNHACELNQWFATCVQPFISQE